jgi:hypothetical protein
LLPRVGIVFDLERGLSDRRLEAAQLPFNGLPQVLQQMKAIRDLSRLRRALARGIRIETRAITADNFDFRMPLEPVSRGSGRAIRQQLHHPTLQIDDDCPESRALPPGHDDRRPRHGPRHDWPAL